MNPHWYDLSKPSDKASEILYPIGIESYSYDTLEKDRLSVDEFNERLDGDHKAWKEADRRKTILTALEEEVPR